MTSVPAPSPSQADETILEAPVEALSTNPFFSSYSDRHLGSPSLRYSADSSVYCTSPFHSSNRFISASISVAFFNGLLRLSTINYQLAVRV